MRTALAPRGGSGRSARAIRATRTLAGFARTFATTASRVGLAETRDALAILASPAAATPSSLQAALRALFCATASDWEHFDEIFDAFWQRARHAQRAGVTRRAVGSAQAARAASAQAGRRKAPGLPDRVERGGEGEAAATATAGARARRVAESLATTDLRHIADPDEVARDPRARRAACAGDARAAGAARAGAPARAAARPAPHHPPQCRRMAARRSSSPGGGARSSRCGSSMLLDASGSMSLYTAFFVRFLHGVVDAFREAEAFVFHTRLAHVSPSLRDRDVDARGRQAGA